MAIEKIATAMRWADRLEYATDSFADLLHGGAKAMVLGVLGGLGLAVLDLAGGLLPESLFFLGVAVVSAAPLGVLAAMAGVTRRLQRRAKRLTIAAQRELQPGSDALTPEVDVVSTSPARRFPSAPLPTVPTIVTPTQRPIARSQPGVAREIE